MREREGSCRIKIGQGLGILGRAFSLLLLCYQFT